MITKSRKDMAFLWMFTASTIAAIVGGSIIPMEFVTELELVGGIILTGAITIAFTTKNCSSDYIISFVLPILDE